MIDIKLDKNYNLIEEKPLYHNGYTELIDLITKALADKIITDSQAAFLLKVALKKDINAEIKRVLPSTKQATQIHSFFMNMKTKYIKHA